MTTVLESRNPAQLEPTIEIESHKKRNPRGVVAVALVAAAAAVGVIQVSSSVPDVDDGSYHFAETQRMLALAPASDVDDSFDVAEDERFLRLAPSTDDSFDVAEYRRQLNMKP